MGIRLKECGVLLFLCPAFILLASCAQTKSPTVSASKLVDANDACYMCHMPFTEEEISVAHLKVGIPCSQCHGKSLAHMDDKTFSTPPDVRYSRGEVNSFCRTCHADHPNVPPERLVQVWIERRSRLAQSGNTDGQAVCTDCHGSHAIARR